MPRAPRVAVTRSREQASGLAARLVAIGCDVVELPVLRYATLDHPDVANAIGRAIDAGALFVFTSALGVAAARELGGGSIAVVGPRAAAVGAATADAAADAGFDVSVVAQSDAAELSTRLLGDVSRRMPIVWIRAADADPAFAATLRGGGFEVADVVAYAARADEEAGSRVAESLGDGLDVLTFASSNTVRAFVGAAPAHAGAAIRALPVVTIGPRTAETAVELGFTDVLVAAHPTIDAFVGAVHSLLVDRGLLPPNHR